MTTFPFNENIPAADNNPSEDQPLMLENNQSTDGILDEDHYTFQTTISGTSVDGLHRQVTLPFQNVAGAQTDPASTIYSDANANSASANSNLWYRNVDGIFPLSSIRACGVFTVPFAATNPVTIINSFNVDNIAKSSNLGESLITVTLTANSITTVVGNNNFIFLSGIDTGSSGGTSLNPVTFASNVVTFGLPILYTRLCWFVVIQI